MHALLLLSTEVVQHIHYLRSLDEVAQRLIALELQIMYCYGNTVLYQRGDQVPSPFVESIQWLDCDKK